MTEIHEPLLVSIMRRHQDSGINGEVIALPDGKPKTGTSLRGFLAELDEYIEAVKKQANESGWHDGHAKGYDEGYQDGQVD